MVRVGRQLGRSRLPGCEMRFSCKDPMNRKAAARAGWEAGRMARLPIVAERGMRFSRSDPMQQSASLPDRDGRGSMGGRRGWWMRRSADCED